MATTPLEFSVIDMLNVFEEYAGPGKNSTMSKAEFTKFVNEQLPHFAANLNINDVFESVDFDKSGAVEFKEFAVLVVTIAGSSYEILQSMKAEKQ